VAYSNRPTTQDIKDKGVSLEINWNTGWAGDATVTSITGLRDWQSINGLDYDFSTADVLYRNPSEDESFTGFRTFSQELRLTGSTDRVDWMVGLFYSDEDLDRTETYRVGAQYEPYVSTLITQLVLGSLAAPLAPMPVDMDDPHLFLSQVSGQPFGADSAGLAAHARHLRAAKSLALFTNDAWRATEARDVTLGLRYTREDKELASRYSNPNGSVGCGAMLADPAARVGGALMQRLPRLAMLDADTRAAIIGGAAQQIAGSSCLPWTHPLHVMRRDANGNLLGGDTFQDSEEKEWSGTLKAAYRWNENVMTYVSAARGYKGGGFNLDRVQSSDGRSISGAGIQPVVDTSFPAEFVDSYELGAKTNWAGGSLVLNATLFHQEYEDFQLNSFLGTSFVVRSIPEVTSSGLDAELLW